MIQESPYSKPKKIWLQLDKQPIMAQITDNDNEILEIESNGDGEFIFRVPDIGHGSPVVTKFVLTEILTKLNNAEFELQ